MMRERGLEVDHTTVWRWVMRYAPEVNKRIRPHLKMTGTSYRVDETYIKVGKTCKYLYRAVDKDGQTIEFMLSAKRDVLAAKRFFKKVMRADHRRLPFRSMSIRTLLTLTPLSNLSMSRCYRRTANFVG